MGIGVVAGRVAGLLSRDLVTRSLAPHLGQAWIAFLWKRGKHLTATVQALVQFIREGAKIARAHR
jgi:DNA-binding transcriptional LysR family regulator